MNHSSATPHLNLFAIFILPFYTLTYLLLSDLVYEYAKLFSMGTLC